MHEISVEKCICNDRKHRETEGGSMIIPLPKKVNTIISTLTNAGFEAYAVGGCVRDTILGRTPGDWDITTSAKPDQIKQIFGRTVDTGIEHGTVTILIDKDGFEVTTYRIDGEYKDARHPDSVIFTRSLIEDLKRRDFTINAMAYNETEGLIDVFDGIKDLQKGIIRCVGDPYERFTEDALRMMRAVRFAAQLGFTIEKSTKDAICALSGSMAKISAERIQVELVKLLISNHPEEIKTLYETNITKVILPEFDLMMETPQNNKHHQYNVGEHTIESLKQIRADKVLRLTMLFHDVAKPASQTTDHHGASHFYGHPKLGVVMAKAIFKRLKFDTDTTNRVLKLVEWHDDNPPVTPENIRKRMNRIGLEQYPYLFEVKRADVLAQSEYRRKEKLVYIDAYEKMYETILNNHECVTLKDLAVSGKELIAIGMKPGKKIGETLDLLLELVLIEPNKNTKEFLMEYVRIRVETEKENMQ